MQDCCRGEAEKHIKRHRDVAVCDFCGSLVLGYDNEADYQRTLGALVADGTPHETHRQGDLWVVAKQRTSE